VKARLVVMTLGLFALSGCGKALVGKWTYDKNSPDLKTAKTIIKNIEFADNGIYSAEIMQTDAKGMKTTAKSTGKYQFNGFQLKLSTKEDEKVWNAMVIMNRTLQLKREGDKLKLKRVE